MHLNTHIDTNAQPYSTIPDFSPRMLTYKSSYYFKNTNKSFKRRINELHVNAIVMQMFSMTIVVANLLAYTFTPATFIQC